MGGLLYVNYAPNARVPRVEWRRWAMRHEIAGKSGVENVIPAARFCCRCASVSVNHAFDNRASIDIAKSDYIFGVRNIS